MESAVVSVSMVDITELQRSSLSFRYLYSFVEVLKSVGVIN